MGSKKKSDRLEWSDFYVKLPYAFYVRIKENCVMDDGKERKEGEVAYLKRKEGVRLVFLGIAEILD